MHVFKKIEFVPSKIFSWRHTLDRLKSVFLYWNA
jgi:hypothetical protein